jgi:hypothetical protein
MSAWWLNAFSQNADSIKTDTVFRRDFRPTGLRLGVDLISPVKSQMRDYFSGWEVSGDIDLYRYLLSLDYGNSSVNFLKDSTGYSSSYKNNGSYWRVGASANFLTRDPDRNVFFIGVRYGRASYSESMNLVATDSIWGNENANYSADKHAHWIELASGLRVKVWKFIWMGYTGSLKFGLKADDNAIISNNVPGYGSTGRDTSWGFTYQLFFRIPFRPTTPILPPKPKK